jgi:TusA-related sulfurtransferase
MSRLRTKLELERMAPGEALEVACAPGSEALENVPRSAARAGHEVAAVRGAVVRIVRR